MATRKEEFVADTKRHARNLWESVHALRALQAESNALDYGSTLGDASGAPAADVLAVVFATTDAVHGLFAAGHATNLAKLL